MRNLMIIGIVVAFVESAWSLSYMGPPTSQMMPNDYKLGLDYSTGETSPDLSNKNIGWTLDLETDLLLARLDYGIVEKMDFYARLGIAEIENLGTEFAWGVGIKTTVIESGDLDWGGLVQIMSTAGSASTLKVDMFEIQLAMGPVWNLDEAVSLYGGPFLHWISGEIEGRWPGRIFSSNIEQKSLLGFYAGIAVWVTNQGELCLEYQKTAGADALGFGLLWRF